MKKRKSTINKNRISKHTKRFRVLYAFDPTAMNGRGALVPAGESPRIYMRSMASVGGLTRRAMKKKQRVDMGAMGRASAVAMLPKWMQGGLAAFTKIAQAVQAKYEASKPKKEKP